MWTCDKLQRADLTYCIARGIREAINTLQAVKIKKLVKNQDSDFFLHIISLILHNYAIDVGN